MAEKLLKFVLLEFHDVYFERSKTFEFVKHGKGDFIVFFNTFFSALDDVVLYGIYRVNRHMDRLEDMLNSESQVSYDLNQELEIYKKRFGEIPREEIDKELFGIDDEKGDKTDDLPF